MTPAPPQRDAIEALIRRIDRRRGLAVTLALLGGGAWVLGALVIADMEPSPLRQLIAGASIAALALGGVGSATLAIRNSYEHCPACGGELFAGGLFAGYRKPVGRRCATCRIELQPADPTDRSNTH